MLENEEIIDQFKKSLSATVKSIGKSQDIEINFVDKESSINGTKINLINPDISSVINNLYYIRAEADTMALEIRLHDPKIHSKYVSSNNIANEIFNVIEKSRIDAKGSNIFKGIKSNIFKKHNVDINNKKDEKKFLIDAFKYVSYCELTKQSLKGEYNNYKKFLKQKLGKNYNYYFEDLRKNINNQKKFC